MQNYGLVSIITPNYNAQKFIAQTIESVLAQTYQNWELLIQDDGSKDDSVEIALRYAAKDSRIKVERNPDNAGAAVTRNNAIKRSQGKWLAFLDSDDIWLPEKLERHLKFMVENDCEFSFTRYEHIDEEGHSLDKQANVVKTLNYQKLLMHNWLGCLTVIYKNDLSDKIYGYDVKKSNDQALFLQAIRKCKNAMGLDECLGLYRIRKGGISRNLWKNLQPFITVYHDYEKHSYFMSYFYVFTHMFVKTFFKYSQRTVFPTPETTIYDLIYGTKKKS